MKGLILLNMGGPDSLNSVKPFLENLFSDRDIIRLGPPFMQKPLSSLILKMKLKKSIMAYESIGGKSPLTEITFEQAKALEDALKEQSFKVYVAMRYWHPFPMEAVNKMLTEGIKEVIALPLYPQFSKATSGSSLKNLFETISNISPVEVKLPDSFAKSFTIDFSICKVRFVSSWYDNPLYIEALIEKIKKGFELFGRAYKVKDPEREVPVLFSAHGLPQKFIEEGDPYVEETKGTINALLRRLTITWHLSYQSKAGPMKWLEPSTEDKIIQLAKSGVKNLLLIPISFVSDHIETLYEIDILFKAIAKKHGMNLQRTESLNTSPKFIEALKDIVLKNMI